MTTQKLTNKELIAAMSTKVDVLQRHDCDGDIFILFDITNKYGNYTKYYTVYGDEDNIHTAYDDIDYFEIKSLTKLGEQQIEAAKAYYDEEFDYIETGRIIIEYFDDCMYTEQIIEEILHDEFREYLHMYDHIQE